MSSRTGTKFEDDGKVLRFYIDWAEAYAIQHNMSKICEVLFVAEEHLGHRVGSQGPLEYSGAFQRMQSKWARSKKMARVFLKVGGVRNVKE